MKLASPDRNGLLQNRLIVVHIVNYLFLAFLKGQHFLFQQRECLSLGHCILSKLWKYLRTYSRSISLPYYAFTYLCSILIAISFSRWVYYDSITENDVVGIHDTMRINDDGSLRIQGPILREKYRSQMLLGCRRAKSGMRSPILVNLTYEKGINSHSKSEKPLFFEEGEKKWKGIWEKEAACISNSVHEISRDMS